MWILFGRSVGRKDGRGRTCKAGRSCQAEDEGNCHGLGRGHRNIRELEARTWRASPWGCLIVQIGAFPRLPPGRVSNGRHGLVAERGHGRWNSFVAGKCNSVIPSYLNDLAKSINHKETQRTSVVFSQIPYNEHKSLNRSQREYWKHKQHCSHPYWFKIHIKHLISTGIIFQTRRNTPHWGVRQSSVWQTGQGSQHPQYKKTKRLHVCPTIT